MRILLLAILLTTSAALADPVRSLKVVVARDASPEVRQAAASIAAATTQPLIKTMAEGQQIETVESEKLLAGKIEDRAYSHLIVVGLMNDPVIRQVWQHEARPIDGGIYVFGFGYFTGDIGYIESDRNPFLHSAGIKAAPFETEIVTLSGTTPAGVAVAAKAFVEQGLINGVVAGDWKRTRPGLLDRDPLPKDFAIPSVLPSQIGNAMRIGVTQASEDEYRGVLQDAGVKPLEIWRAKYYLPSAWDGKGWQSAMKAYHAGLHRRATGNTLWAARFASEDQAKQAAPRIAQAAQLQAKGDERFVGKQPPFTTNDSPGSLTLWRQGEWLLMSTLPE